jgi:hypothetical protein
VSSYRKILDKTLDEITFRDIQYLVGEIETLLREKKSATHDEQEWGRFDVVVKHLDGIVCHISLEKLGLWKPGQRLPREFRLPLIRPINSSYFSDELPTTILQSCYREFRLEKHQSWDNRPVYAETV